jgi:hypothetical protein
MADVAGYILGGGAVYVGVADSEAASIYLAAQVYAGIPSPRAAYYLSGGGLPATTNIRYYQRVLDNGAGGTGAWCYYSTLNVVNPSPLSAATSPNWTGATPPTSPQVVASIAVP